MIRPGPILLKTHLKGLFEELEKSDALIEAQREFQKAAIDASCENFGTDPAAIRQMKARRKKIAKDPAQVSRSDELYDQYKFMLEGGISPPDVPSPSDELSRVMALTNTAKPPKIEAIRKALGCSQGKAHKLRSQAAARLATKSSSSSVLREHEHLEDGQPHGDSATAAGDETVAPATPVPPTEHSTTAAGEKGGETINGEDGEASQDASPATSARGPAVATPPSGSPEREARHPTNTDWDPIVASQPPELRRSA